MNAYHVLIHSFYYYCREIGGIGTVIEIGMDVVAEIIVIGIGLLMDHRTIEVCFICSGPLNNYMSPVIICQICFYLTFLFLQYYDFKGRFGSRDCGPPSGHFGHGGPPPPGPHGFPGDGGGGRGAPPGRRGGGGRAGRRDDGPPGVSLLVRNVSPDITTQDLQLAFGRIGEVRDVYIPRDFHSQQSKGFAFIEYATPEMAREARDEMDKFLMKGRELEVVYAQEKRKSPREMRGRVVDGKEVVEGKGRGGRGGGDERGRGGGGGGGDFQRSSSFERHKIQQRERENYFRPEDAKRG